MKISTKGRYALRTMVELALHDQQGLQPLKEIAARQDISLKYLEQIMAALQKNGYVQSVRGSQGGYRLARPPKEYTVGQILRLIEGDMAPVACMKDGQDPCPRQGECTTLRLWKELDEAIRGVIDRYTLADLVEWSREGIMDYTI